MICGPVPTRVCASTVVCLDMWCVIVTNVEAFHSAAFAQYALEVDIIDSSAEKGLGMSPRRMQSACNVVKWGILCVRKCDGSLD